MRHSSRGARWRIRDSGRANKASNPLTALRRRQRTKGPCHEAWPFRATCSCTCLTLGATSSSPRLDLRRIPAEHILKAAQPAPGTKRPMALLLSFGLPGCGAASVAALPRREQYSCELANRGRTCARIQVRYLYPQSLSSRTECAHYFSHPPSDEQYHYGPRVFWQLLFGL